MQMTPIFLLYYGLILSFYCVTLRMAPYSSISKTLNLGQNFCFYMKLFLFQWVIYSDQTFFFSS